MTDKSFQPTLAGLRAFVAVAEKRHFGSAATTLGVSQSTLSQALAALETGLGSHLVERSTRRVRVTPEGMQLLPLAHTVIDAAEAFTAAVAGTSDPLQGSMRLGLIPTVAPYVLPAVLAGLAQRLPALTLRVVEDQTERLLASLRDGALDAALISLSRFPNPPAPTVSPRSRSTTKISCSRCRPGIRCRASAGCRWRRWPTCRCCCSTRVTACAIRPWTSARRRECRPILPTPGRPRWRRRCNA